MITGIVQMMSRSLGRHVSYSVIIPDARDAGPGPYPVLYQLHGSSDDHTAWINRSNLARHVAHIPLLVICPDGAISYWLNASSRERYEDFMMNDLPEHVANTYHIRPGKAAIGGLSMGGYGALRLALKYPDRFASVWAHSAAIWTEADLRARPLIPMGDVEDANLYALAERAKEKVLPAISFDCGTDDFLISHNRKFHAHLDTLGIKHTYQEHPGIHSWDYWDEHVKEALRQHTEVLGLQSPTA